MNLTEFVLLGLVCTVYPLETPEGKWVNQFVFQGHFPEITKKIEREYDNSRKIAVYEVRKQGAFCGYQFAFINFPPGKILICGDVSEIWFEQDAYKIEKNAALFVTAYFTDSKRPEKSFTAAFHVWGDRIYHIEVPVEDKRIGRHERE